MKNELNRIIEAYPTKVFFKDIVEFTKLEERISAVGVLFVNTIDVGENYIEFCPDHEPPLKEEVVSWIWSYRPNLSEEILNLELSDDFRLLVSAYKLSEMNQFWDAVS